MKLRIFLLRNVLFQANGAFWTTSYGRLTIAFAFVAAFGVNHLGLTIVSYLKNARTQSFAGAAADAFILVNDWLHIYIINF